MEHPLDICYLFISIHRILPMIFLLDFPVVSTTSQRCQLDGDLLLLQMEAVTGFPWHQNHSRVRFSLIIKIVEFKSWKWHKQRCGSIDFICAVLPLYLAAEEPAPMGEGWILLRFCSSRIVLVPKKIASASFHHFNPMALQFFWIAIWQILEQSVLSVLIFDWDHWWVAD